MLPLDDTIAAIASPAGGAARGIVRVSGPQATALVQRFFVTDDRRELAAITRPTVVAGCFRLADTASPLPCELYVWPGERSYTGSPVAEIHTLGSRPLLESVVQTLCAAGARLAGPGEFTLRAFLAGRIDLTQAEAVLGVIDAADPDELDVALAQLAGGLARPLHELRDGLLELLAHLEAGFDFADEDLPFITREDLDRQLAEAAESVAMLVRQMASRGRTDDVMRAVLVGRTNVGKSSLFNALARSAGALVSDLPGTTRDYLTAELDLAGVKCQLIDTAGVESDSARRDTAPNTYDDVQQVAQAVGRQQSRRAHVRIVCLDSTRPMLDCERDELAQPAGSGQVVVLTKIDLGGQVNVDADCAEHALPTSSVTGEGIDALREELRRAVLAAGASGAGVVAGTAARCRESLRLAAECLRRARQIVAGNRGEELVAVEIRVALEQLGQVVGAVYADDVLDRIFSRFCIGK